MVLIGLLITAIFAGGFLGTSHGYRPNGHPPWSPNYGMICDGGRVRFPENLPPSLQHGPHFQSVTPRYHVCFNTRNFTGPSWATEAAEASRRQSFEFWTGRDYPKWSKPCPIDTRPGSGGGATRFAFDRGEVFGWNMVATGSQQQIVEDVIPHEVDHAVRASLTRAPIARTFDEGASTLFEGPAEHARHRELAKKFLEPGSVKLSWFDASEYPQDMREVMHLYSFGHCFTQYLVRNYDRKTLLAFQADQRKPSQKYQDHFGESWQDGVAHWRIAFRDRLRRGVTCAEHGCILHNPSLPDLIVFTAPESGCIPCRQFEQDLQNDSQLRAALGSRFHVITRPPQRGMAVPTFVSSGRSLVGYKGAQWLVEQLGVADTYSSTTGPSVAATSPIRTTPSSTPAVTSATADVAGKTTGMMGWFLLAASLVAAYFLFIANGGGDDE